MTIQPKEVTLMNTRTGMQVALDDEDFQPCAVRFDELDEYFTFYKSRYPKSQIGIV